MSPANEATIVWDGARKQWRVRIRIGAEVINRPVPKARHDASEDDLRDLALETAASEGYRLESSQITVHR